MQKQTRLLLIVLLLLLVGCSSNSVSTALSSDGAFILAASDPVPALFQDSSLPNMKGVEETEALRLFIDETNGVVAVLDKSSQKMYYTNPPERSLDVLATGINKDKLSAQLIMDYYNQFGQLSSINSYTDSVVHNQISVQKIDKGIRVNYQFGSNKKTAEDIPMMLSYARYEELTSKMDNTGQRALKIAYRENKEDQVYVRNDGALQGLQLERALQAFDAIGYTADDLMKDAEEHGIALEKASSRSFLASIEYVLDSDSLLVRIPVDSIQFPADYPINMITPLAFFGAAGTEEQGSIFVPDGSGALIHYNNGKHKYPAYQQMVYGLDQTMDITETPNHEQTIRMPVFGMISSSSAFLGIIEEGASVATLNADVSGRLNSYNYVYPSFYVLNKDDVTLDANGQRRSLPRFQAEVMGTDYTVRYYFMKPEEANYEALAEKYKSYLLERNGLPKPSESKNDNSPFYLQLMGSYLAQKHLLGMPYKTQQALTTFQQAEQIVSMLQNEQVNNIQLKYSGWFNGGMDQQVPNKVKVDRTMGGMDGLNRLQAFAEATQVQLYPEVAFLQTNSKKRFKVRKDAVRNLREIPAVVYPVDLALDRRDRSSEPAYLVSPRLVTSYTNRFLEEVDSLHLEGIAIKDLASVLFSDFNKDLQIDRHESEQISIEALQLIADKGYQILSNEANAYALPFVTHLTNAPMTSSGFKIEDESIPFYQMVIRGSVEYTGKPYNFSTYKNENHYVLKSMEYGAGVHFQWMYEPNEVLKNSDYNHLYALNYELWFEQAVQLYKEVDQFLKLVQGQPIAKHEKLEESVYQTTYGNGVYVIVNYNDYAVSVKGLQVEAEGYVIGGESQ